MDIDHAISWSLCLGLYSTHFSNLFYLLKNIYLNSLGEKISKITKDNHVKFHVNLFPFFSVHRSQRPDPALAADSKVLHWFLQPLDMTQKINARSKRSHSPQASATCWTKTDLQMPAHSEIKWPTVIKLISKHCVCIPMLWLSKPAPHTTPLWGKKIPSHSCLWQLL